MDKAKASISNFMAKAGHHDTTVHETVSPAVQHETVKPHHHEEVNTAVDKEVHQDHYHRTVQPVQHREVLPEKHTHKLGEVQHREFDNRDHEHTKRHLATEQAAFTDKSTTIEPTTSQSAAPVVGGEHVHHHIHETIQPVIHKETIQPNVVHTTVPIHEVHHKTAQHHNTTSLPPVSLDEFKSKGGALTGREERYDAFEGEPKNIGGALSGIKNAVGGHNKHDSHHTGTTGGLTGDRQHDGLTGDRKHDGLTGERRHDGLTGERGHDGLTGNRRDDTLTGERRHDGLTSDRSGLGNTQSHNTTGTKPSLVQKLNPFSDTDHDGKKGVLE